MIVSSTSSSSSNTSITSGAGGGGGGGGGGVSGWVIGISSRSSSPTSNWPKSLWVLSYVFHSMAIHDNNSIKIIPIWKKSMLLRPTSAFGFFLGFIVLCLT